VRASDLISGKPYVFRHGSLAVALRHDVDSRALFSVHEGPTVFVDGGLQTICHRCCAKNGRGHRDRRSSGKGAVEAKNIQSLFSVLEHSVRAVLAENEVRGLAGADAVVSVPLGAYSSADTKRTKRSCKKVMEPRMIDRGSLQPSRSATRHGRSIITGRDARKLTAISAPQFIKIEGDQRARSDRRCRYLKPFQDKPIEPERLDNVLTRLTGQGRYDAAATVWSKKAANRG